MFWFRNVILRLSWGRGISRAAAGGEDAAPEEVLATETELEPSGAWAAPFAPKFVMETTENVAMKTIHSEKQELFKP